MFTGIIEDLGIIKELRPQGESRRIVVECHRLPLSEVVIGDSISVNGACLTVVQKTKNRFEADLSPETLVKTTFLQMKAGAAVNLERAVSATGRLNGHLVQGHVDGVGKIRSHQKVGHVHLITIEVPSHLCTGMIEKGSVAVDGISLTINDCGDDFFTVSIIPLTASETTIGQRSVGDRVNIETDLIGKYVQKFLKGQKSSDDFKETSLNMDFLVKTGFL